MALGRMAVATMARPMARGSMVAGGDATRVQTLPERIRDALGSNLFGFFYFTDDFAGLYQDTAGTTPVTAVGQSIGLMLDRRFGLGRGAELVPQPLNLESDWTETTPDTSIQGNTVTNTGSDSRVNTGLGLVTGKFYELVVDVQSASGDLYLYNASASVTNIIGGITSPGIYRFAFIAGAPQGAYLMIRKQYPGSYTLNDLSVRELPGNHARQPTSTARPTLLGSPLRLRTDFVDDVITMQLDADCDIWVNTPHGHYKAHGSAGTFHLPLNDMTGLVAVDRELSEDEYALIAEFFGTPQVWGAYLSPTTETSINARADDGQGDGVFHFVGDNGAAVTKVWPRANEFTSMDLFADGLSGPMMIMPDIDYGPRHLRIENRSLAGSIPTLDRAPNLTTLSLNGHQLTGSIPLLSEAPQLGYVYFNANQLTGKFPDMTESSFIDALRADNNQLTGYAGGSMDQFFLDLRLDDNALTQAAVDDLLRAIDEAGYTGAGRLFLHNPGGVGSNAAPSAVGLAHAAAITARGWNVQVAT